MFFLFTCLAFAVLASVGIYKYRLVYQNRVYKADKIYLTITMGGLMLLTALRGMYVGNDTYSYYSLFKYYIGQGNVIDISNARLLWLNEMEIGYRILNYLFGHISNNYQLYIAFIALLTYGVAIRFIWKYSTNITLSVILFFLLFFSPYSNVIRQILGLSFVLLAFDDLNKSNNVGFFIKVFLAFLFHKSAFIAFFLFPMAKVRARRLLMYVAIAIAAVIVVLGRIPVIVALLGVESVHTGEASGISIMFRLIKNIAFLFFTLYLRRGQWNEEGISDQKTLNPTVSVNLISWTPLICVLISVIAFGFPIAARFEYYFTILYIILVPQMIKMSTRRTSNISFAMWILIIMLIVHVVGEIAYRPEWVTEYNYYFFWKDGGLFK
ncbi:MAG: EpsG family protein [Lachnospiraceae bacterium]|nr:EpsG family protein [Lachnospiraceae bacterium]